jgi:hypothetical protein
MSKNHRILPVSAPDDGLARLLADAAPPRAEGWAGHELRGEADAVAAFRLGPDSPVRGRSWRAGKLFVLKTVIAAVALSGGGVAFAAVTGHLPASSAPARSPAVPARPAVPPSVTSLPSPAAQPPGSRLPVSSSSSSPPAAGPVSSSPVSAPAAQSSPSSSPVSSPASVSVSPGGSVSGSVSVSVPGASAVPSVIPVPTVSAVKARVSLP